MRPTILGLAVSFALLHASTAFAADRAADAGPPVIDVVSGAVGAMDATPAMTPVDVDRLVSAFGAQDWHVVVAAMLGLAAYLLRRFSLDESWLQSPAGAAVVSVVLAAIGGAVPLLAGHASWRACAVTAVVAGVTALAAMARPDGRPNYMRVVDGVPQPDYRNRAAFAAGPLVVALLAFVLLCGLAASGCATFGEQPVALQRAERDAFACASPAIQSAIHTYAPMALDALAGVDVDWRAGLGPLQQQGVNVLVCTVAHLLYDALGDGGVQAVASGDLVRAAERRAQLASAAGDVPPDTPTRRVLLRGALVLQEHAR